MTTPEDSFHLCPTLSHCLCVAITRCSHLISLSGYLSLSPPRKHRLTHTHSWAGGGTWAVKLFKLLAESVAIAGRKWGSIHKCLFIDFTRPVQRPWLRSFPVHSLSVNGKHFTEEQAPKILTLCVEMSCMCMIAVPKDSLKYTVQFLVNSLYVPLFVWCFNQKSVGNESSGENFNFLSCTSMKGE